MTATTRTPTIFDISWPNFAYQDSTDPDEAHHIIRQAHQQAPIALGPYGPEVLEYDLVRTVLRDSRFTMPRGISLVMQGITSGPVWDKVCQTIMCVDAAEHHRLRRLVSRAFTPRAAERMRTACTDVITELVDRHSAVGRCDMVHDIARQYPVPIICALVGAPTEDWQLFARWADDLSKAFGGNVAAEESAILRAWQQLDAYLEEFIARRRRSLGDDRSPSSSASKTTGTGSPTTSWSAWSRSCSMRAPTPHATSWPLPCKCYLTIRTSGRC